MEKTVSAFLILMTTAVAGFSQPPAFDVASIKPNKSVGGSGWNTHLGYVSMRNQTLKTLVGIAYSVPDDRVLGGPRWIESDHFDVDARAAAPAKDPELLLMLQNLLTERFQLALHRETKTTSGFFLAVNKSGLKMQPDETDGPSGWNGGRGKIVAQRITMAKLADTLTRMFGAPVVDMTNAKSRYSFTLEWVPEHERHGATPEGVADAGPSIFTALAHDLGLKLESKKVSVEMIVIDRAEQPTEN
jgi:uncharacterized protein (TIGR03435 family)